MSTARPALAPGPRTIAHPPPGPLEQRVLPRVVGDLRRERRARRRGPLPPGSLGVSPMATFLTLSDPLALLLDHHRRFGDVFSIRAAHEPLVWVLGAEGTHQLLVSDADAFAWRPGRYRDLRPLLGDGLLSLDGPYHRDLRRLLLPAFHREQVERAVEGMVDEAVAARDALSTGTRTDVYAWTRTLTLRIAMRCLLGMRGDGRERELAHAFDEALRLYGLPLSRQLLRGPGSPYARAMRGRRTLDRLIRAEVADRRAADAEPRGVLDLLIAARTAEGEPLDDAVIRDQVVTLLFAGHDTTTATLAFALHELSRAPAAREALTAELDAVLDGRPPTAEDLRGDRLPVLERTLQETLRRWPVAWIGPRRTVRDIEVAGVGIPAGVSVQYSSWATHHLPELWPDPLAFDPDRFLPAAVAARPAGAYAPFGGGSRMCLGKRFGEFELRALLVVLLQRFRFEADAAVPLRIATTPTLGPADGMWFWLRDAG